MTATYPEQKEIDMSQYADADSSEFDGYDQYAPDFLQAIGHGAFDEYLRQIARACFVRRDVLLGRVPTSTHNLTTRVLVDEPVQGMQGYSTPTDDSDGCVTHIAPIGSGTGFPTFEYNGKHYRRSDLIGRVVRIRDTRPRGKYTGLRVRIIGLGPEKVKVEWVDQPVGTTRIASAKFVFIPYSYIVHVLG